MPLSSLNPYLTHNFAPTQEETYFPKLEVVGQIPQELSGWYIRNGPNPQFPQKSPYHWFDGDGMLHSLKIANQKASYRNRYIRTLAFEKEREAGQALWTGLLSLPQKDNPYGWGKNSANTSLVYHHGKLLALWEGGLPHQIDPYSLKTLGEYDFEHRLTSAFTAHPKIDPLTGEMMFFSYSLPSSPHLYYSIVSSQGKLLRTVPIDLPIGVMMHDFAITENYTIFMDLPLTFDAAKMYQGKLPLGFDSSRPSRFGILPRHGDHTNIRWFSADPCYVLHCVNAYEDGAEIVLTACRMPAINLLFFSEMGEQVREEKAVLYQWKFNLATGNVQEEMLSEMVIDFPRLNEQYLGRRQRFAYAAKRADKNEFEKRRFLFDGLIKYDFQNGEVQTYSLGEQRYGGEAVFVPRSNESGEDEGWLLTLVYDEASESSELLILDASDLTKDAIAKIRIPFRIPFGFHGIWLSRSHLLKHSEAE
ncbi:MAG: carotenoid oxygenase family protein [Oscillatoria sp. PMC 1068.18]|nr:carotenoid oxygenase family protein [Oscillatoria sp. PMC 1076.18]MEC4987804.1 carotenoid oxygenase family protein [Oscillatoria sp. PMC 1068.18]